MTCSGTRMAATPWPLSEVLRGWEREGEVGREREGVEPRKEEEEQGTRKREGSCHPYKEKRKRAMGCECVYWYKLWVLTIDSDSVFVGHRMAHSFSFSYYLSHSFLLLSLPVLSSLFSSSSSSNQLYFSEKISSKSLHTLSMEMGSGKMIYMDEYEKGDIAY